MIFIKFWKTIAITLVIFWGSISSGNELNKIPFLDIHNMDKLIHFLMYFTLIISLLNSIVKQYSVLSNYKKLFSLFLVVCFGGLMEFSQFAITSDRSAEFCDIIANCIGAIVGLIFYPILTKIKIVKWL
ncbi:MAG: hypothetical protein A2X13_11725 [Bacteroidetes bacterium GWC2_33_15]|nr:MAG: hypothetical protein A2X10_05750 [Bacteroidetes bacterium GWA2_33_15]OFX50807.1 MAG: hypothetical protein A2X13_11725 [Bacteroidetes bacterium GWC2_33_15]OFX62910.1 MAG: hypothetical protein A2X15_09645 [Bacteroidetes bacterium GWB2_32_14]OFX69980.1 MAG: hypothetical protein A2X14_02505 [Bacteroidetes bacterium GWD2_33_33]HAN18976.1 VanZ family protein [Bacteroidales bacterium]